MAEIVHRKSGGKGFQKKMKKKQQQLCLEQQQRDCSDARTCVDASAVSDLDERFSHLSVKNKRSQKTEFVSIDVEAVASGPGHNDRVPCWVAVVNEKGDVLLDAKIKVDDIFSPLTEITGVTVEMLQEEGRPFDEVILEVHSLLGPHITIVGQSIQGDIDWLRLEKGVHFGDTLCLAEAFKVWNPKFEKYMRHSLANEAFGLLGKVIQGGSHSPIEDAQISMELYRDWVKPEGKAQQASKKLFSMFKRREFPSRPARPPGDDRVCSYKFNPAKCFCGQSGANDVST